MSSFAVNPFDNYGNPFVSGTAPVTMPVASTYADTGAFNPFAMPAVDPFTGLPVGNSFVPAPADAFNGLSLSGPPIDPSLFGQPNIDPSLFNPGFESGFNPGFNSGVFPPVVDPYTGLPIDPSLFGQPNIDPSLFNPGFESGFNPSFNSGVFPPVVDPYTGFPIDPVSGLPIDPTTGMPLNTSFFQQSGLSFGGQPQQPFAFFGGPQQPGGMFPPMMPPAPAAPAPAAPAPAQDSSQPGPITQLFTSLLGPIIERIAPSKTTAIEETSKKGDETDETEETDETSKSKKTKGSKKTDTPEEKPLEKPTVVTDTATALSTLVSEGSDIAEADDDGGSISTQDLSIVAKNKDGIYSADAQGAAKYMLSKPGIWSQIDVLDGKDADTKASLTNVSKALNDPNIVNATGEETDPSNSTASDEVNDNATALEILSDQDNFDSIVKLSKDAHDNDNFITLGDLIKAKSKGKSAKVRNAATYILSNNRALFEKIDNIKGTVNDDLISITDVSDAISDTGIYGGTPTSNDPNANNNMSLKDVLETLQSKKDDLVKANVDGGIYGGRTDLITRADLDKVANSTGGTYDAKLVAAAKQAIANNDLMKYFASRDEFNQNSAPTAYAINFDTLADSVSKAQDPNWKPAPEITTMKDAMKVVNDNIDLFDPEKDGIVTLQEIKDLKNSRDPKVTSQVKVAIQYIEDHNDEFEVLDKADVWDDDAIQRDTIAKAVNKGAVVQAYDVTSREQAIEILTRNDNAALQKIDGEVNGDDDLISDEELVKAMDTHKNSNIYTAEERKAMWYLWTQQNADHRTGWDDINGEDRLANFEEVKKGKANKGHGD